MQQKKKLQMYLIGACLCDGIVQQQKWGKVADAPLSSVVYADGHDSYMVSHLTIKVMFLILLVYGRYVMDY